jgi:hypothetical protein
VNRRIFTKAVNVELYDKASLPRQGVEYRIIGGVDQRTPPRYGGQMRVDDISEVNYESFCPQRISPRIG